MLSFVKSVIFLKGSYFVNFNFIIIIISIYGNHVYYPSMSSSKSPSSASMSSSKLNSGISDEFTCVYRDRIVIEYPKIY